MSFMIILQQKSKFFFCLIYIFIYENRCQEFVNHIDTYFLIDEKSPSRLELINRVSSIDNQFNEYIQTINQEITEVE